MTNYETPQTPDPTEKPYWTPSDDPKTTSPTNSEAEPSVTSEAAVPVPDYVSAEADAPPASRRRWLIPVGIAAGALTIGLLGGVAGAAIADGHHDGPGFGDGGHGGPLFDGEHGDGHDFDDDGDFPGDSDMPDGSPSEAPDDAPSGGDTSGG